MRHAHRTAREGRRLRFESIEPRLLLAADWTGLDHVRAAYGLTGQGQTVAVIDTGIAYDHVALGDGYRRRASRGRRLRLRREATTIRTTTARRARTARTWPASSPATTPERPAWPPGADIVALRVFDDQGRGQFSWVEEALRVGAYAPQQLRQSDHHGQPLAGHAIERRAPCRPGRCSKTSSPNSRPTESSSRWRPATVSRRTTQPGLSYPAVSPHVVPVASVDANGEPQLLLAARRAGDRRARPQHPQHRARLRGQPTTAWPTISPATRARAWPRRSWPAPACCSARPTSVPASAP